MNLDTLAPNKLLSALRDAQEEGNHDPEREAKRSRVWQVAAEAIVHAIEAFRPSYKGNPLHAQLLHNASTLTDPAYYGVVTIFTKDRSQLDPTHENHEEVFRIRRDILNPDIIRIHAPLPPNASFTGGQIQYTITGSLDYPETLWECLARRVAKYLDPIHVRPYPTPRPSAQPVGQ